MKSAAGYFLALLRIFILIYFIKGDTGGNGLIFLVARL